MSYQFCSGGSYCYSSNTTSVTASTIGCVSKLSNSQFSITGSRIYNTNFVSESIYASLSSDIGFSGIESNLTSPATQWGSTGNSLLGPMNREAVWFDSDCNGSIEIISGDLTISYYFYNSGITNQYYLGFGAYIIPNGKINLTINNNIVLSGDASLIGSPAQLYHKFWHIIPITLLSCDNYINLTITSSGVLQNAVGMVIYDNTYSDIINATGDNDLDIIFSTESLLTTTPNKTGPFVKAGCPSDYMLSANTVTATCITAIYTACTCTCCDRYSVARIFGDENFVYNDCNNQPKVITNLNTGESIQFCACSIITPKVQLANNLWSAGNGQFRVTLISSCDSTCISIPDGPPPTPTPEPTCSTCGFTIISVGDKHTIGISGDTLFSWGDNSVGQLGIGTTGGYSYTPQQMIDPTAGAYPWTYVEAGAESTFAINSNGDLYVCGTSATGDGGDQLGLNDGVSNFDTLTQVTSPSPSGWSKVWSKFFSTIALRTDGTIWGTGDNAYYQLGLGIDTGQLQFTQIGSDVDWQQIARGLYYTIGLKTDGTIYSWGTNTLGNQLNNPLGLGAGPANQEAQIPTQITTPNYPLYSNSILYTQISAGDFHSVALSTDTSIWGWGLNTSGQLDCLNCGAVDYSRPSPMDGGVSVDPPGFDSEGRDTNSGYTFIIAIANTTLAITSGITLDFQPFTASNGVEWYPNLTGTRIWTWGNGYGGPTKELLQDEADRIALETKNNWCYVWAGGPANQGIAVNHDNLVFFAKDIDGNIFTWGTNEYGQLGVGQTPICPVCNNNYVGPIGLCFNSVDSECPCPACQCVIYRLFNYSTNVVPFNYIDCDNNLQTETLPAGLPPFATDLTICACLDTIVLDTSNPNLVVILTDQNPCES